MNMKKKMTVHRLLSGALVLLGFASCSNEDENLEIRCEYGTPYSKFLVKGTVKGEFKTEDLSIGGINEQKVYFNDIDGEENGGAFKSDSVLIKDMNQKKLEEGGHWYVGKFEFSPKGSIKLSKKEKNRED